MSLFSAFCALFKREILLGSRQLSELATPVIFFLIIIALFPLGLGLENKILIDIAPSIIWIAALLASIQIMERLFRGDFEDGSLEQLLLSGMPLSLSILAKITAHWCLTSLPLIIIAPILSIMLLLPPNISLSLTGILLIATPALALIGAMGVALTIGLRRAGLLISVIVLPLYVPLLIFGTQAIQALINNYSVLPYLALFAAINILCLVICPIITAFALKISLD